MLSDAIRSSQKLDFDLLLHLTPSDIRVFIRDCQMEIRSGWYIFIILSGEIRAKSDENQTRVVRCASQKRRFTKTGKDKSDAVRSDQMRSEVISVT